MTTRDKELESVAAGPPREEQLRALIEKVEIGLARSVTADNLNYTAVSFTIAEALQLRSLLAAVPSSAELEVEVQRKRADAAQASRDYFMDKWERLQAEVDAARSPSAGGFSPKANGRVLDGRTWDEMPSPRA